MAVRPEDRPAYIRALQHAQAGQGDETFNQLLCKRLDATQEEYLIAAREARYTPGQPPRTIAKGAVPAP